MMNPRIAPMLIDKQLLTLLVCPVTKTPLQLDRDKQELVSTAAKLAYPVREGIPVMLEDEARAISQDEFEYWHAKK
ncbi:MAG: hypothetical protein ACI9PX_000480 [Reinekea sp.]|jgi:uncharacterized protein YbaR (Trm112 family)